MFMGQNASGTATDIDHIFQLARRIPIGAFRLDAKQREAKVGDLRQPYGGCNLRKWLLIFATGRFIS